MTLKVAVISECLYCNTPIKRGKYCSKKCFGKAHTTSELRKCQTCNIEFKAIQNKIKKGWDIYCSLKCRKLSSETRQKIILINKTRDYSNIKLPQAFKLGHVPWNKDKKHSQETIDKIRQKRIKQQFLKADTSIEKKMKEALRRNGLKFEEQYNLDNKFLIDIAIPELKIAIECDGEYWHSLPRNQHVDKQKQIHCDKYGWQLLRFTDKEINTKLDDCINIIFNMIKGVMQRVE